MNNQHIAPSGDERLALGRRQRNTVSRTAHGQLLAEKRTFDPMATLFAAEEGRLKRLLPLRHLRMSESPFAFFRGAVAIMAADLGRLPRTDLHVQLCGDAHVRNLGSFASPEGNLIFDLNDFDETIRGPWEWDLKRMATSIILAGREAKQHKTVREGAVEQFVESYRDSMANFVRMPILEVARHRIARLSSEPIHAALRQSERARPLDLLKKLMEGNGKRGLRFRDSKPWSWRVTGEEAHQVLAALGSYRETLSADHRHIFDLFRPIDVGFKVAGIGSVGVRDYVVLLEGNGRKDPLFLQIKQEVQAAYAQYFKAETHENEGRRVAQGQKALQPVSDLLLGWTSFGGHDYVVRQFNDHKGRINLATLKNGGLESLAKVAGELLARGHARSGDACAISGYCGKGEKLAKAIRKFACQYADLTEADFANFLNAIRTKRR